MTTDDSKAALAVCQTECTSGCHADDCEHHGHLPMTTSDTPEAALWSLMKQGWRITGPDGSDVPPPAFLAALDGWTLVPRVNPLSNFGDDENDRMPWQQDEYSEADRLRDAEIARLRVALERISEAAEIALDARGTHIADPLWTAMEPLRHATREARRALAPAPSER